METTTESQETRQTRQTSASAAYEPFAGTYSSDLQNMLAAHNAALGHSLSPSVSFNEHLSPETILSESAYGGMDQYGSFDMGNDNEHITSQQFNEMLSLSDPAGMAFSQNSGHGPSGSLGIPQSQTRSWVQHGQDMSSSMMPSVQNQFSSQTGPLRQINSPHLSPSQGSPAGSSSSRQLISPIVRVESYEETSRGSHFPDNLDRLVRQSSNHLSPYDVQKCDSDSDSHSDWQHSEQQSSPNVQRHDDGSWSGGVSGQKGLSPQVRHEMRDLHVQSLDEMEESRQLAEKNAGVQDWLARSEVGSEAGDDGNTSLIPYPHSGYRRRAKSTNDLGNFNAPDDTLIPGPGAYLNVPSDYEEEDDYMSGSSEPQSPPAHVELQNQDSYFPAPSEESLGSGPVPWADPPTRTSTNENPYQPPTANLAISRFKQRAKDIESASLAATMGSSRRRSESDIGSVLTAKGISRDLSAQTKDKPHRSLFQKITPRRVNSNQRKRKGPVPGGQSQVNLNDGSNGTTSTAKELQNSLSPPKRMGSWGKAKSPKLDTSPAALNPLVFNGNNLTVSSPSTPWGLAKNAIRRTRSKSEIGRSRSKSDSGRSLGLGELMTQFGGPPMPTLASPSGAPQHRSVVPDTELDLDDDSGDEAGGAFEGITMDLAVRTDPVIPTYQGFHNQASQLNPRIPEYLLERVTKEQLSRYQRLLAAKAKHVTAVKAGDCPTKVYCFGLGGKPQQLKPRIGNKDADTGFQGFQIIKPGMSAEEVEKDSDGTIIAAQFPSGVPLPPVDRLPAEFECPLCFRVKKFYKPSDWTKHVHEDVQPFTCTFPTCNEPKSFKRKADWVRHENERHRQLESWTCDIGECVHTCYRKDNFVQHLVREHKIPEPKARTGKGAAASSKSPVSPLSSRNWVDPYTAMANPSGYGAEDIWMVVERCRGDTSKQPQDEACKFCGNICNSWKKLTVHLAKHMEQISMPILPLVEAKHADGVMSSVSIPIPHLQRSTGALTDSPQNLPTYMNNEPLAIDLNDPFSQASITPGISVNGSQVMHTYPPPQHLNPHYAALAPPPSFSALPPDTSFATRSYPGPMPTSRRHTPSGHSSYSSSIQGSNYPPPRSVSAMFQQQQPTSFAEQVYHSPVESNGFNDDTLSEVDAAFMLSSGHVSNGQSPVPTSQTNTQQHGGFHGGINQGFAFPQQHYNAYGFGGTAG